MIKHFLSLQDLTGEQLMNLVDHGLTLSETNNRFDQLTTKHVAVLFKGPSTRTRTSFIVGAQKLGAQVIQYGKDDLQLCTGETIADTIKVLSSYIHALVIRTNASHQDLVTMANQQQVAIINAMSAIEHPTQVIADLITIKEKFKRLTDLHILYVGEGNNTAASLAIGVSKLPGLQLTLITPQGYGMSAEILSNVKTNILTSGAVVNEIHDIEQAPRPVDVIYTTRWQTMGVQHSDPNWLQAFLPLQVNQQLVDKVSQPGTIFMHDLPAVRGQDTTDEVLEAPYSLVFRQASHKLTAAMTVLNYCLAD